MPEALRNAMFDVGIRAARRWVSLLQPQSRSFMVCNGSNRYGMRSRSTQAFLIALLTMSGIHDPMFDHCLYFNTAALARQLERAWTEAYKPFGLTAAQGFLLRAVLRRPGILQGQLAETLAISRPTATRALDGLAGKALITRQSSNMDGREVAVHPTASAIALQIPLDEASAAITADIKRLLGEGAFADLVAGIREVRTTLK